MLQEHAPGAAVPGASAKDKVKSTCYLEAWITHTWGGSQQSLLQPCSITLLHQKTIFSFFFFIYLFIYLLYFLVEKRFKMKNKCSSMCRMFAELFQTFYNIHL